MTIGDSQPPSPTAIPPEQPRLPAAEGKVRIDVVETGFVDPFDVTWRERLTVLGSVAGVVFLAFVVGIVYAHDATLELIGLIPASIVALGKFLPLVGLSKESSFTPWDLALVIWALDTVTVLGVIYGLEAFYRFRRLKGLLERIQANASLVLTAYPKIRKAAVVGVFLFVLFPVAGTGALVGSFLGILLRLPRKKLIAVVSAGGLVGGFLMAVMATMFGEAMESLWKMQQSTTVKYTSIAIVAVIVAAAFYGLNRVYKRAFEQVEAELESAAGRSLDGEYLPQDGAGGQSARAKG